MIIAVPNRIQFQFTPLVRGATISGLDITDALSFNSRPSCEGRRGDQNTKAGVVVSIHAPRARGDASIATNQRLTCVSIHAPRARGDRDKIVEDFLYRFNSRPSCEGRRGGGDQGVRAGGFNSRPSCEGRLRATSSSSSTSVSIHAPRARGDTSVFVRSVTSPVSIHAPRARGDLTGRRPARLIVRFNSRPSCEGRQMGISTAALRRVSIHAPRARGD